MVCNIIGLRYVWQPDITPRSFFINSCVRSICMSMDGRFTSPECFPHYLHSAQIASLSRAIAICFQVGTSGQWQPVMGATSRPINWHGVSILGRDVLEYCSQRLSVKRLSTTTFQTHGLPRIKAVKRRPIRRAASPFCCRFLIFRTIAIICSIKRTVSWLVSFNCLNTLFYHAKDGLAMYTK